MAEGLLKNALSVGHKGKCVVSSAGLGALVGYPPDPKACQLMMEKGINISVETCPHYLAFDAESIPDGDTRFKCCPPIRDVRE